MSDIEKIIQFLEAMPVDCLGFGDDGENTCWPYRNEVIDGLKKEEKENKELTAENKKLREALKEIRPAAQEMVNDIAANVQEGGSSEGLGMWCVILTLTDD